MCEPSDDWNCKDDELERRGMGLDSNEPVDKLAGSSDSLKKSDNNFSFRCGPSVSEDDDELTESKIRAFLDTKALELKKLQTPLYEEFYNSVNASCSPKFAETPCDGSSRNYLKLPPKSRSPNRVPTGSPSTAGDATTNVSPSSNRRMSNVSAASPQNISPTDLSDWKGLLVGAQQESSSPGMSFSEIQRKWKEELDQELERKREMMRQVGVGAKTSSPKDRGINRQRDRSRFASPSK